jgi:hypothetical protein
MIIPDLAGVKLAARLDDARSKLCVLARNLSVQICPANSFSSGKDVPWPLKAILRLITAFDRFSLSLNSTFGLPSGSWCRENARWFCEIFGLRLSPMALIGRSLLKAFFHA